MKDPIELRRKKAALLKEARALIEKAEKEEERKFTEDEAKAYDELLLKADGIDTEIDRIDAILQREKGIDDKDLRPVSEKPGREKHDKDGKPGFRSFGEFAQAVYQSGSDPTGDGAVQLRAAATTYGSTLVGADGGFAIPDDDRDKIVQIISGEASLLDRCDQIPTAGNTLTFPKDETTPWQTSGGILAFWEGEGTTLTQTKPALLKTTVTLDKLTCLVGVTDELLEDAPALTAFLTRKAAEKMGFKINLGIVQGNGAGMPLGILAAPCTVSITKAGSQVADTLTARNIIGMYARMYAESRLNAVWLINQDIEPQLFTMTSIGKLETGADDTSWGAPLYVSPRGLADAPYGTLLGRPILPTQACETLGDKGDIIFADLSQYLIAKKATGLRAETSIHLWFDADQTAFRFIWRMGGQPWWAAAMSPRDGSNTLSPFVTLAERT